MVKAQATLFIILTIFIVAVLGILLFLLGRVEKFPSLSSAELDNLKIAVSSCVESEGESALYLIGMQGGYIDVPVDSIETNYSLVAYAFHNNRDIFISKKEMEKQLNKYMERAMPLCVNFSLFPSLNITYGRVESDALIYPEKVVIDLRYPLTVRAEDTTYRIDDVYSHKFNVRLGLIHDTVKSIVQNQLNNKYIDITFMLNQEMPIYSIKTENTKYVYAMHDTKSELKNQTYMFMFAFKY